MGGEWRTLGLYGQEINFMTSAIARMNLLLHGVEDFEIQRGDTLADPKFVSGDRLRGCGCGRHRTESDHQNPEILQWNFLYKSQRKRDFS